MLTDINLFSKTITPADRSEECISYLLFTKNKHLNLSIRAFRALIYKLTKESDSLNSEDYEYLSELYDYNRNDGKVTSILLYGKES